MVARLVVDTNVWIAALISHRGSSRDLLRGCLQGHYRPLMGSALFAEYEAVAARAEIIQRCPLTEVEIQTLLDAFCSVCEWVPVYYLWRPNLVDEGDNHVLELAAAGNAHYVVTHNLRDFERGELQFDDIRVVSPSTLLEER